MKSYVSTHLGPVERLRELLSIYSKHVNDVQVSVAQMLKVTRYIEARLEQASGRSLKDAAMLEIGAGQGLVQLTYFSIRARSALGIDMDVVPNTSGLADYARMWRQNGTLRTRKTVARKALGIDARARHEVRRQLAVQRLPAVSVLQMDASAMSFPDNSFDAVYFRAVFEHLSDPQACLREVRRVLKPGGGAVFLIHLYTSLTGCHDARVFAGKHNTPYWAHLRPEHSHLIHENTYLNHLRLSE